MPISWNPKVKLILSDVDETIADLYVPAEKELIHELTKLLEQGIALFLITGAGLQRVQQRIINLIPRSLRSHILIAHCSGAEVWSFNPKGHLLTSPYYSLYDSTLTDFQKQQWREVTQELIDEFHLKTFSPLSVPRFKKETGEDPRSIIYEDRGPQITLEFVNGFEPEDLRLPVLERAEKIFEEKDLPLSAKLGGVFALDFVLKEVSKTTAVKTILSSENILNSLGLTLKNLKNPEYTEIWGDKFSISRGGTDRHMSEALDPKVRSIDFREEDPAEFLEGYNIILWDGQKHLHHGLLEYLKSK